MKLLIVEDQRELLDAVSAVLQQAGYRCEQASTFLEAEDKVHMYAYDAVVVDINLPGGSGLDIIRIVRKLHPATGVLVISARDSLENKLEGLEIGADDYITKPFDMAELAARVRSVLRRRHFSGKDTLRFGDISIDTTSREVFVGERSVDLTKSEYDLLLFFFTNPRRVLSKESLAEHVWGDNMDLADSFDFIYSHIKNLRKKLTAAGSADPIKAVYGIGYRLAEP